LDYSSWLYLLCEEVLWKKKCYLRLWKQHNHLAQIYVSASPCPTVLFCRYIFVVLPQPAAKHHTATHLLPPSGVRQSIRRVKVRKVMDWDKDILISKAKNHVDKKSKIRNSFTTSIQQTGSHTSQGKQDSVTQNGNLGRQTPSFWTPFSFFSQLFIAQHDIIWYKIPLWSVWVSCPSCVPFQLLVHHGMRRRKGLGSV